MAEAHISQWNVKCIICEGPADHHCNTCGDLLCSRCRIGHLRSRATSDHVVVPYDEKVEPQNASSIRCSTHQSKISEVWCKTCNTPACLLCVTSSEHKQHEFNTIADQIAYRRGEFQEKLNVQNNSLREWEKLSSDSKQMSSDYEDHVNKLDAAMTKRANEIGTEVKNILIKHQKQLREKESTQKEVLHATEKTINDGIICIKNESTKIEDILRDREHSTLLQHLLESTDFHKLEKPTVSPPTYHVFTPGHLDTKALEQMFGSLVLHQHKPLPGIKKNNPNAFHGEETVKMTEEYTYSKEQETTDNVQKDMSLITSPSTVLSMTTKIQHAITYVSCCKGSDTAWIRKDSKTIQLVKRDGRILDTITTKFVVNGMGITKQGELLVTDYIHKCIKSVSKKGISILFKTDLLPGGICSLINGDILVTFADKLKVIKYKRDGKVVQELDSTHFKRPWGLAQNEITEDLYVCSSYGVSITDIVSVFTVHGEFRYDYSIENRTALGTRSIGISTDQGGRVFIPDYSNSRVHVLDKDGQLSGYIDVSVAGLINPRTIDVDDDGYAWIGCPGKMGVLKYLQY